jgi:hypothetical protein
MKPEISFKSTHFLASILINGSFILFALWLGRGQIAFVLFVGDALLG